MLTQFGQVCTEENAPLYLVDGLVKVLREEYDQGLCIEDICICGRRSFLQHLLKQFHCPKTHFMHIGIESLHPLGLEYRREFCDSVLIVMYYYNFLDQVHDLLNDVSIWGDVSNFQGTVNLHDPFSNEPLHHDGLVDELVDGQWFIKTNQQCKILAPNEPYIILLVVRYIDKAGNDVNQQNKLEPFSFTFDLLNHACRYHSKAWCVLGFMPDFKHKSSAVATSG